MSRFWLALPLVVIVGCGTSSPSGENQSSGSQVLFVIAHQDFRDEELIEPKQILEDKGYKIVIASTDTTQATGMLGLTLRPDLLISEVKSADYLGIVIVGGTGIQQLWDDTTLARVVVEFHEKNKIIGAICLAPVVLARAGILQGRKATCFHSAVRDLEATGASYEPEDIVVEGKIVTANGPVASNWFGYKLAELLGEEPR